MVDNSSKIIVIPDGTKEIKYEQFMDSENIEEVIMPDSIEQIGAYAFKGCKNLKKIKLSNNLYNIGPFAFSECTSLEEIELPKSISFLPMGIFTNCYNLKKLNILGNINHIGELALLNCKSLKEFEIPKNTEFIGTKALMGCDSISEIHIPESVSRIELGAFSLMKSLKKITVDKNNKKYLSDEDTSLISKDGVLIQYAIAKEDKELELGYYKDYIDVENTPLEITSLVFNVADYAFAGCKNLEKIYISSELESIGKKTFYGCKNLKDLEILCTRFGSVLSVSVHNNFRNNASIPFENIIVGEGIKNLCSGLCELFKNAKNIKLPSTIEEIGYDVFNKSSKLKQIILPENIYMILPNTFHNNTNVVLPEIGTIKGSNFNTMLTKLVDNYYIEAEKKYSPKIISLNDGTYYVKVGSYGTIRINSDEIKNLTNFKFDIKNVDDFIEYIIELLKMNVEHEKLLYTTIESEKLREIFENFINDMSSVTEIASQKIYNAISEILNVSALKQEFIFNETLITRTRKEDLENIIQNYNKTIDKFIRLSDVKELMNMSVDLNSKKLIDYCNLLDKYKVNDRFYYNYVILEKLSKEKQELLIKNYSKNLKNILKKSGTMNDYYGEVLNDFIKMCQALGVFDKNKIFSQKMMMFITDVMSNENNPNKIVNDDIHSIFTDLIPREETDYEFVEFFIDNYNKLVEFERNNSGLISRIYNSFRDISKSSTSHRGGQRHLKVTVDKCRDYFVFNIFTNINDIKNKDLPMFLSKYYTEERALTIADKIVCESKGAPRNIFTKINYDENNNPIYSYNENEDLKENNTDDFSYEWLPKQDYNNLILGKLCSCCAHILGAGAGIMHASMILDNCQNMVIRNELGNIIAKMMIYVNKKEGYAVFNTTEVNLMYQTEKDYYKIYKSFMRGANAFVKKYNQNNEIPISIVTIGEHRNLLIKYLTDDSILLKTPDYSSYGYFYNNYNYGKYSGDDKNKQLLVLKTKKEI